MIYTNGKKERIPIKNKPQKKKKKKKKTQVRQTKLEVYEIHKFLVYFKTASTPLQELTNDFSLIPTLKDS